MKRIIIQTKRIYNLFKTKLQFYSKIVRVLLKIVLVLAILFIIIPISLVLALFSLQQKKEFVY
jgi:preprotein translocase subunit SecG